MKWIDLALKMGSWVGFSSFVYSPHALNRAVIHTASNHVFCELMKNIASSHFVHEKALAREIPTSYLHSIDQLDDVSTKSLSRIVLQSVLSKLGLINIYKSAWR